MQYSGYNTADLLYEKLVSNGLDTIEGCKDDIPIVIQSFELEALEYFKTLTDLPNTLVLGVDRSNLIQKIEALYIYYF